MWNVILQDAEISTFTRDTLDHLLDDYNDIKSSASSDMGYTIPIEIDKETNRKLPKVMSKPYTLPLNTINGLKGTRRFRKSRDHPMKS